MHDLLTNAYNNTVKCIQNILTSLKIETICTKASNIFNANMISKYAIFIIMAIIVVCIIVIVVYIKFNRSNTESTYKTDNLNAFSTSKYLHSEYDIDEKTADKFIKYNSINIDPLSGSITTNNRFFVTPQKTVSKEKEPFSYSSPAISVSNNSLIDEKQFAIIIQNIKNQEDSEYSSLLENSDSENDEFDRFAMSRSKM
ncbi:hypothetical protein NEPAR04_0662 [Nematocida parisii]|nr:hypothetical protein NEPAR03_0665 [Nematocida parisii]KAI5126914.1 hypothetical protein NEPAR08_0664 [Nematocida parisii]KAI5141024.1 hypothetical protein NEPAR04_0662 [Nematocida parisii]